MGCSPQDRKESDTTKHSGCYGIVLVPSASQCLVRKQIAFFFFILNDYFFKMNSFHLQGAMLLTTDRIQVGFQS